MAKRNSFAGATIASSFSVDELDPCLDLARRIPLAQQDEFDRQLDQRLKLVKVEPAVVAIAAHIGRELHRVGLGANDTLLVLHALVTTAIWESILYSYSGRSPTLSWAGFPIVPKSPVSLQIRMDDDGTRGVSLDPLFDRLAMRHSRELVMRAALALPTLFMKLDRERR